MSSIRRCQPACPMASAQKIGANTAPIIVIKKMQARPYKMAFKMNADHCLRTAKYKGETKMMQRYVIYSATPSPWFPSRGKMLTARTLTRCCSPYQVRFGGKSIPPNGTRRPGEDFRKRLDYVHLSTFSTIIVLQAKHVGTSAVVLSAQAGYSASPLQRVRLGPISNCGRIPFASAAHGGPRRLAEAAASPLAKAVGDSAGCPAFR
jgi:hypothetical protein